MSIRRFGAFLAFVSLFAAFLLPTAQATDLVLASEWADPADAVVNTTVLSTRSVQAGGSAYTVAELAVDETLKGEVEEILSVVYAGGEMLDGSIVIVSHMPQLRTGGAFQVALGPVDPDTIALVGAQVEGPLYKVVGSEAGAVSLDGGGSVNGINDYVLMGHRWKSFSPPAAYKVNPSGSPVGSSTTIAAVQRAADRWVNDPNSDIEIQYAGTTTKAGANLFDGTNTISFQNRPADGWLAIAHVGSTGGDQYVFDIIVNTRYALADGSGSGQWFDIETTLAHELGHVLGLGHPPGSDAEVMYSSIASNTVKPLGLGDLNGVKQLYPAAPAPAGPTCMGQPVTIDMNGGASGIGTPGVDVILGTPGADVIKGMGGDDLICAGAGNDNVRGGPGNDTIDAGAGNDRVDGDGGNDTIQGRRGNDTIFGGGGSDMLFGGDNDDHIEGQGAADYIDGQNGKDVLIGQNGGDRIIGGLGIDELRGTIGPDELFGGDGKDALFGGAGDDVFRGGGGNDLCQGNTGSGDHAADASCEQKSSIEIF